jgi:hypothetical protein
MIFHGCHRFFVDFSKLPSVIVRFPSFELALRKREKEGLVSPTACQLSHIESAAEGSIFGIDFSFAFAARSTA